VGVKLGEKGVLEPVEVAEAALGAKKRERGYLFKNSKEHLPKVWKKIPGTGKSGTVPAWLRTVQGGGRNLGGGGSTTCSQASSLGFGKGRDGLRVIRGRGASALWGSGPPYPS